jgi:hypothetical protein
VISRLRNRTNSSSIHKETTRMTSLSLRLTSVVSSILSFGNRKRATWAEDAQDGAGQGRSEGVCSAHDRMRTLACVVLSGALLLLFVSPAVSSAQVAPWWHLDTNVRPAVINPGAEATLVLRASNVGNACTGKPGPDGELCTEDDEGAPVTLSATLPPGLEVVEEEVEPGVFRPDVHFFAYSKSSGTNDISEGLFAETYPFKLCHAVGDQITCNTEFTIEPFPGFEIHGEEGSPLAPYEYLEIRARVKNTSATEGAEYEAEVSGGGANPIARKKPLPIGSGTPPFGVEHYDLIPEEEGGLLDARAASHPYQLTTTFALNQNADETPGTGSERYLHPPAMPRNLHFRLPPGQIGDALATPQCTEADFVHALPEGSNLCPPDTAIGVAAVTIEEPFNVHLVTYPVPLFNLAPAYGEPVRFGFELAHTPVVLDTALRSGPGEDYGVTVTTANTSQLVNFLAATVTFWGTPGDQSHDNARGWACLAGGNFNGTGLPCELQKQQKPSAFLTLPADCAAPFETTVEGDSWTDPTHPVRQFLDSFTYSLEEAGAPKPLVGCNQVPFDQQIHSEPTSNAATSPTGLSFDINVDDQGLLNPEGLAQSQLKKAVVTLPQGFTTNPSVAEGLKACSEAEYEAATLQANSGCTPESKVGDVEVASPLVRPDQILHGGLYVATQHDNPNYNLLTLYLIAREPEIGVLIKQALEVRPDPATGQLTTEVDEVPQLPFSHFHLSFRQGQRSPLVTPPACGPYAVKAKLYPWSNPDTPIERESSFQITQGPEGQPCPSGGVPPFHPNLEAGTQNNAAGSFSPFYTHITRRDSEQEITHFSIKLPPGVIGKLAGVSECSDAQIAAAKAREVEGGGSLEEQNPSCPANSEVGHTLVGSGVGNVLAYAPGKLYLAGPYHGSNISLVSITAAKVGPFDLGTVVVRFALRIDPETAEVFVDSQGSDPIPHIVDGIPIHLRDIRGYVDRPNFTLNPTSCAKKSTASTILGSGLNFASEADDQPVTVTSPFQAADCASLGFKPKLALSLKGGTRRGATPAFKAVLTYPKGSYANIAKSVVTLPHSEFLEQGHIGTICTRVQFKEGKVPGEKCPAASVYGKAMAITPLLDEPLKGPVYLRSSSHNLPDLVAALHNRQVDFALDGRIDSVKGGRIRNSFETVPDAPVSKFVLEMRGGKKGLLVNSTNLCRSKHHAISEFTGQNGKLYDTNPALKAKCGGKKAKKKGKRHS